MLGERSEQRGLWEADRLYLDHVGKDTFYGLLASLRGQLFRDAEFAEFYCADNGRDSVPPSLLATALLLQTHDKVSDAEAKARADFDIRWKVVGRLQSQATKGKREGEKTDGWVKLWKRRRNLFSRAWNRCRTRGKPGESDTLFRRSCA